MIIKKLRLKLVRLIAGDLSVALNVDMPEVTLKTEPSLLHGHLTGPGKFVFTPKEDR